MTESPRSWGSAGRRTDVEPGHAPTWRDHALVVLAVLFGLGSVLAMVVTVAAAERSVFVIVVEVATWIGATAAIVVILWRRTVWGRRG